MANEEEEDDYMGDLTQFLPSHSQPSSNPPPANKGAGILSGSLMECPDKIIYWKGEGLFLLWSSGTGRAEGRSRHERALLPFG
ncbi:hypothetical protein Tco_1366533, partial [Tanacetum coccineum]